MSLADTKLHPESTNGWWGIWHGQIGNAPYKYSGGLGTYPWQHNRVISYSPLSQRTFFVLGTSARDTLGSDNLYETGRNQVGGAPLTNLRGNTIQTSIGYLDHRTGRVSRPHILSRKPGAYDDTDPHENPVLEIDKRGYLWVFIPSHGPDRIHSFIYRSALPGEINDWVEVAGKTNKLDDSDSLGASGPEDTTKGTNFSYPDPHYLSAEDAFLFIHTKYTSWARRYIALSVGDVQTDLSVNWTDRNVLFEVEQGHYCVTGQSGSRVGMGLNLHPQASGLAGRTNLYYFELEGTSGVVKNIAGDTITTPITTRGTLNQGLIHDYESEGLQVYLKQMLFTPEEHPLILYVTTNTDNPSAGSPRTWKTAHWNGNSWERRPITTSNHNYDHGSLIVTQDPEAGEVWSLLAPTSDGPQSPATGGSLVFWQSVDQGQSWQKVHSFYGINEWNHGFARTSESVHPDASFIWADGDAFAPSASNIYLANQTATRLYRLPRYMATEEAYPVPVSFQDDAVSRIQAEAESLTENAETTGTPPSDKPILGLIADGKSSGGTWLSFRAQAASGYALQLQLPELPAGDYTLKIRSKKSFARGQFQVWVNAQAVGEIQEGYVNQASAYVTLNIGNFTQAFQGPVTLGIQVLGKHPDATGYAVSLDRIDIQQTIAPQLFPEYPSPVPPEVILDTQSPGTQIEGSWLGSTASDQFVGSSYLHDNNADKGEKTVTWSWTPDQEGWVEVALLWNTGTLYAYDAPAARAHSVPIRITQNGNVYNYVVDQREGDGTWSTVDKLFFIKDQEVQVRLSNEGTSQTVVANGLRFRILGEPPAIRETEKHLNAPQTTDAGEVQLTFPILMEHPLQRWPDLYWSEDLETWSQSGLRSRILTRDTMEGLLQATLHPAPNVSFWKLVYPE